MDRIDMETLINSYKYSMENNSSIYLSMHGGPAHRNINEEKYSNCHSSRAAITEFIWDNYCIIPDNIIYITTTKMNYTLSTNPDDEEHFKQLFSNLYWSLEEANKCLNDTELPYQIYYPRNVVYNQDLIFDSILEDTFDIFHKNGDNFQLYNGTEVTYPDKSNAHKKIIVSQIKHDILTRRLGVHRPVSHITGYLNTPKGETNTKSNTNLRRFFEILQQHYPDLWKNDSPYLIVFAPYCNPTWYIEETRTDISPNYINDFLRNHIQNYGMNNYIQFKG